MEKNEKIQIVITLREALDVEKGDFDLKSLIKLRSEQPLEFSPETCILTYWGNNFYSLLTYSEYQRMVRILKDTS